MLLVFLGMCGTTSRISEGRQQRCESGWPPQGSFTSMHLILPDGSLSFQSGPQEYASTEIGLGTQPPQGSSEARSPKETAMAACTGPEFHEASLSCDMSWLAMGLVTV